MRSKSTLFLYKFVKAIFSEAISELLLDKDWELWLLFSSLGALKLLLVYVGPSIFLYFSSYFLISLKFYSNFEIINNYLSIELSW